MGEAKGRGRAPRVMTTHGAIDVRAYDEGEGPLLLILHPGLDDGRSWAKVASHLRDRFRVVRIVRRQYRLDLKDGQVPMAEEVADVRALVDAIGRPRLVIGHSSGAVLALEALAADPALADGGFFYEPPLVVDGPLAGPDGEVLRRARAAQAAGRPGRALGIFLSDIVKVPRWVAALSSVLVALVPHFRRLVPCQLDDVGAIDALGVRLADYGRITAPCLLLGGDRSPAHLAERLDALEAALPSARRVMKAGWGHDASQREPEALAAMIADFAAQVG